MCNLEFVQKFAHYKNRLPCTPVFFSPVCIDEARYKKLLNCERLKAILATLRCHQNIDAKQAEDYCRSPAKHELVNIQSFKPKNRGRPLKAKAAALENATKKIRLDFQEGTRFHEATGTYQLSNRGTKKPVLHFIIDKHDEDVNKFVCLHLSEKTWDTYYTEIKIFLEYFDMRRLPRNLPTTTDILLDFICYLRHVRKIQYESIKSYLSAIKKLHDLNNMDSSYLSSPLVNAVLDGIKIDSVVHKKAKKHRCVVTFDVLQLLGHSLSNEHMDAVDKQMIWTLFLFGFFGSRRMGEFISNSDTVVDVFRSVTWDSISRVSKDHYALPIKLPKVSDDPVGFVIDFLSFKDKSFCPIANYNYLCKIKNRREKIVGNHPVFCLSTGALITQRFVNMMLDKLMTQWFPNDKGKWTCHSFRGGLASEMASRPDTFNKAEVRLAGLWNTDVCDRYSRLTGHGRRRVHKKIERLFRCVHLFIFVFLKSKIVLI